MTRCSVIIKAKDSTTMLYRHCDGNLEHAGKDIELVLNRVGITYTAENIVNGLQALNADFEITVYPSGDASYEYEIIIKNSKECHLTATHYGDKVLDKDFTAQERKLKTWNGTGLDDERFYGGLGQVVFGVKTPIIRGGDPIEDIIVESLENTTPLADGDVIGITKSVIARAQFNYCFINDVVAFMADREYSKNLLLFNPVMSRSRFCGIFRAFARYADKIVVMLSGMTDELGNPTVTENPHTGVVMRDNLERIAEEEGCKVVFKYRDNTTGFEDEGYTKIDCTCRPNHKEGTYKLMGIHTLNEIMNVPVASSGYHRDYGLLGSEYVANDLIQLLPRDCDKFVKSLQHRIKVELGADVEVMVFGDGAYTDPLSGISMFADPTTALAFTDGLNDYIREPKVKYLADDQFSSLVGKNLDEAVHNYVERYGESDEDGHKFACVGTMPRRKVDVVATLFDLCVGSGANGCPIAVLRNAFSTF